MANILTAVEAATVLRCDTADANMLQLLPLVDAYIRMASGRDWGADTVIRPEAKSAARMLLVRWHEDPGGMAAGNALGFGLTAALVQLEAQAMLLESAGVPGEALAIAASNLTDKMDAAASLVLIFNHPMTAGVTGQVSLRDGGGAVVASTNALDVTGKVLTINPTAGLASDSSYKIVVTAAADVFGQTLTAELRFTTA